MFPNIFSFMKRSTSALSKIKRKKNNQIKVFDINLI